MNGKGCFILVGGLGLLMLGCAVPATTQRQSDLVAYLSKKDEKPLPRPDLVALKLPLRVGVAFVPGGTAKTTEAMSNVSQGRVLITMEQETRLASIIKDHFAGKAWVRDFRVIPSSYLKPAGGFEDLARVAQMSGVDVVILVSLHQVQFTDPKWYSWTYWTLVGAYTVKGDKNDTNSFVDGAAFYVADRTLLFRAGGTNVLKGSSTWAKREEELRKNSMEGLTLAVQDLCVKLDQAEGAFREDVAKGRRKDVQILDDATK